MDDCTLLQVAGPNADQCASTGCEAFDYGHATGHTGQVAPGSRSTTAAAAESESEDVFR